MSVQGFLGPQTSKSVRRHIHPRIDNRMVTQFGKSVNRRAWVTPAELWLPAEVYQWWIQFLINYKTIFHSPSRALGHKFYRHKHDLRLLDLWPQTLVVFLYYEMEKLTTFFAVQLLVILVHTDTVMWAERHVALCILILSHWPGLHIRISESQWICDLRYSITVW